MENWFVKNQEKTSGGSADNIFPELHKKTCSKLLRAGR
jgi:hypothetical protein